MEEFSKDIIRDINRGLEDIGDLIGTDETVSTYYARHSWATIASALGVARSLKSVKPSTLRFLERMDAFLGLFAGKRRITSEQVKAAFSEARFSSEKIREAVGTQFSPLKEVIEHVARHYRADFPLK